MAYRPQPTEPNNPNWTVRVVPNKFPALQIEGDLDREGLGLYDRMNGIGAHEVIIETPDHKDKPCRHADESELRTCSGPTVIA